MAKRLCVNLLPDWVNYSHENPDGPPTYLRETSEVPGPLQFSWAWYKTGKVPGPSDDDLIDLAKGAAQSLEPCDLIETKSGACAIGRFGTAVFRSDEFHRFQAWYLSNGYDFVTVTHICPDAPDNVELQEAQQIVEGATIVT